VTWGIDMNNIFKSSLGFHIDLSKIVAISEFKIGNGYWYFVVDVQLRDLPLTITSIQNQKMRFDFYSKKDSEMFGQVRRELIDAWIAYNTPANRTQYDPLKLGMENIELYGDNPLNDPRLG
jgi:hypothetical protein